MAQKVHKSCLMMASVCLLFVLMAVPAAPAPTLTPLRLSYGDNLGATVVVAAIENGFFTKYGLAVNAFPQPRAQLAVESLIGGSSDIASGAPGNRLIFAAADNLPIVAIGLAVSGYEARMVVPVKDTTTKTIRDLVGKRVAIQVGSATYGVWASFLKTQGLSLNDFKIVNLDVELIPAALQRGEADAGVLWAPFWNLVVARGIGRVILTSQEIAGPVKSTYARLVLTSRNMVTRNPDVLRRFMMAWVESLVWINKHPDEAARMLNDFYFNQGIKLDLNVIKEMLAEQRFDRVMVSQADVDDIMKNIATVYKEVGRIKEIPDVWKYIDNSFARYALNQLRVREPLGK
ncbi:MAG: ABC transporter substrate-binding protein [Armatimonadota bacterium]|nr:ABC transporter substrate-binding protein [Armatimonadota bacterium]MDR7435327.1 ABC transporter substrate-binding protein [Armatimonadota bacterium]